MVANYLRLSGKTLPDIIVESRAEVAGNTIDVEADRTHDVAVRVKEATKSWFS